MTINKYLDISTAHVTKADMEYVRGGVGYWYSAPVISSYSEGAFFYAVEDMDDEYLSNVAEVMSESFIKVLRYASANDCYLIRIDADGDLIDDPALDIHCW